MTAPYNASNIEFVAGALRTLSKQARDAGDPLYADLIGASVRQIIEESPFHQTFPDDISYPARIMTGIVTLSARPIAGVHRLHDLAYLLHRCGAALDVRFHYEHGPRSDQLAIGIEHARADRLIRIGRRKTKHGNSYSLFTGLYPTPDMLGSLPAERAASILQQVQDTSAFVLELATSIIFLRDECDYYDKGKTSPVMEVTRRKPVTATADRIAHALRLLHELGLDIPSPLDPALSQITAD